jgi:hypothetical protein
VDYAKPPGSHHTHSGLVSPRGCGKQALSGYSANKVLRSVLLLRSNLHAAGGARWFIHCHFAPACTPTARKETKMSRFTEKVLKRAGRKRLIARVYKDRAGTTKVFIDEPVAGSRSAVTRTHFTSLEAANRALGGATRVMREAYSWALRRDRDERPGTTGSDESWRIR